MIRSTHLLAAVSALTLAACAGPDNTAGPAPPPANTRIACRADVRAATVSCAAPAAAARRGSGPSFAILGGQGVYVRLDLSNVTVTDSSLEFDARLYNLLTQDLGSTTSYGTTPTGFYLFFDRAPTTTGGSGTVLVANADGTGTFTGSNQAFYFYDESVIPAGFLPSSSKRWVFSVPSSVTAFSFDLLVQGDLPAEGGVYRWLSEFGTGIGSLSALWGTGPTSVFAVGQDTASAAAILRYDGTRWNRMSVPTLYGSLLAVGGSGPRDIFAVGDLAGSPILHYDGSLWTAQASGSSAILHGVWSAGPADAFAVGDFGTILHWDGGSWSPMTSGTTQDMYGVWGIGPAEVYAVGDQGTILFYDGSSWSPVFSGSTAVLRSISGSSSFDIFVVGDEARHYDGEGWSTVTGGSGAPWLAVTVPAPGVAFSVDQNGQVESYLGGTWQVVATAAYPATGEAGIWALSPDTAWVATAERVDLFDGCCGVTPQFGNGDGAFLGIWAQLQEGPTEAFAVSLNGAIEHYDGYTWSEMLPPDPFSVLSDVWGSYPGDVFAVGYVNGNTVLHYDGLSWTPMATPTSAGLLGVGGTWGSDVFAVGAGGTIMHYDGASWSVQASGTSLNLASVWAVSSIDVFAVGNAGTILHYDGSAWSPMTSGTTMDLYGVWGSSGSDVYAVGAQGVIHFDGSTWSPVTLTGGATGGVFYGVHGTGFNDVYIVGPGGGVQHWDGAQWTDLGAASGIATLNDVWVTYPGEVFVAADGPGRAPIILHGVQ